MVLINELAKCRFMLDQKIIICKLIMKGIHVNFIYWSKCDNFCLGLHQTCNQKSEMTQWGSDKPSVGNIALMIIEVDLVILKSIQ